MNEKQYIEQLENELKIYKDSLNELDNKNEFYMNEVDILKETIVLMSKREYIRYLDRIEDIKES